MDRLLAVRGHVPLGAVDESGLSWIEVLPTADKARNGPWYFTITREDLDVYATWVRDHPNAIPVDYDHEGDKGGSSRAAGWFTGQAEVRDTEAGPRLFAEVKWTPRAVEEIRAGEFKFISPVHDYHERDAKTGLLTKAKSLIAATLTNRPYFRELSPVMARDLLESDELDELGALYGKDIASLVLSALGGDVDAVRAAVWTTAYINDLPDSAFLHVESGSKDGEGKTTPRSKRHFPYRNAEGGVDLPHLRNALSRIPQSNVPAEVKQRLIAKARRILERSGGSSASTEGDSMSDLTVIASELGLADDADEDTVIEAVKTAKQEAAKVEALEQKVTDLEAKASEADADKTEVEKLRDDLDAERKTRFPTV